MHRISADIEDELAQICREADYLSVRLSRLQAETPLPPGSQGEWEAITICASATEKIYTGFERIMTRLARDVDGVGIDKLDNWHRALLDRMIQPFPGRGAIITVETSLLLDRLRAFRHRQRNSYGFALDAEIVLERAGESVEAFEFFAADIRRFLTVTPDGTNAAHHNDPTPPGA